MFCRTLFNIVFHLVEIDGIHFLLFVEKSRQGLIVVSILLHRKLHKGFTNFLVLLHRNYYDPICHPFLFKISQQLEKKKK